MAKAKKVLSTVLVALFTVFTVLSYVPAQTTKAAAGPKVQIVAQPNAEYKVGDRVLVKFNSPNYKGIVQYRAFLWNRTTQKFVQEIYKDYPGFWYKPVCVGTSVFTIDVFYPQEPGTYYIGILVKAKGAKTYSSYVYTSTFTVKAKEEATIKEFAPVADVTVDEGAVATLPATVKAVMTDGTEKEVAVTWPAVDTTKVGTVKVEGTVEGTTLKPAVNVTVKAVALKVESVSAIKANALKVVFNKAVDTTKASFEVKNGSFLVPVTVAWDEAKKEATLTKSFGKYMAGDYTVLVKGLEMKAGDDLGKVTVAEEAIDTIKFKSTTLLKTGDNTATIGYTVLNQYGEDITKTATISGVSSFGTVSASQGVATVTKAGGNWATTDTTGSVTLYNGVKSVTATVTLAEQAAVNSVTLGSLILPKDVVRLIPSSTVTTANISFTAVDQYGNELTLNNLTGITPVYGGGIGNATIIADPNDSTKKVIRVDVPEVTSKTTATLTLIVNNTGKTSTTTFDMYPAAKVADFTLTPDTKVIKKDVAYKVWIDAVDTYGDAVKAADLATYDDQFAITSLNTDVFIVGGIEYDSAAKKAYIAVTPKQAGKTANLVVTLKANGKNATLPISVNAASEIVGMTLSANSFTFADGGSAKIKASFIDQYNEAVKTLVGYTVEFATSDATVIDAPETKTVAEMVNGVAIAPKANQSGKTAKLTVTLKKGATTVDSQDVTIKVIDSTKTTLTYTINDIPKLNGLDSANYASPYAASISLTAKDSAGTVVYVPSSVIKSVTSTNPALVSINTSDKTQICGLKGGITTGTEASATLTVIVENYDGTITTATKTVTVSKEALAAASLKVYLADGTEVTGDIEGVTDGKVIVADKLNEDKTNVNTFYFEAKDQYGVVMTIPSIVITNVPAGATVTYDSLTGILTVTDLDTGKSFNITAITANGLVKTVKVIK